MEKHKCKLCFKSFANGRALGGHMRSHMLPLHLTPKPPPSPPPPPPHSPPSSSSETSKRVTLRRRSKRIRRQNSWFVDQQHFHELQWQDRSTPESPVSSISDTSPEEDVAYCLIMLSRDKWSTTHDDDDDDDDDQETEYYKCDTCNKVFKSYQALGGHKASHKRIKSQNVSMEEDDDKVLVHECPVCFKVFASGQALGGHKRSHVSTKRINLIDLDLNLPAPVDEDQDQEDEMSQFEVSVVSNV